MLTYTLIIFGAAVWGILRGFRRGFMRQIPSLLGLAFGIVSARLLAPGAMPAVAGWVPMTHDDVCGPFCCDTVASSGIFLAVYFLFSGITSFLGKALKGDDRTILDNLGGAVLGLFKWLLFTSIALNLLLACGTRGALIKAVRSDDGNAIEEVLLLSPALLGGEDADTLGHRLQLQEAKRIS